MAAIIKQPRVHSDHGLFQHPRAITQACAFYSPFLGILSANGINEMVRRRVGLLRCRLIPQAVLLRSL